MILKILIIIGGHCKIKISNYYLIELLKEKTEFPPQISVSVQKTCETNKTLIKYCYCGGCNKKNKRIIINQTDLIQLKEFVKIDVIYSMDKGNVGISMEKYLDNAGDMLDKYYQNRQNLNHLVICEKKFADY